MTPPDRVRLTDPQIDNLRQALRRNGQTEPDALIERARPLLQRPDSLVGLYPITRNLEALAPHFAHLLPDEQDQQIIEEWVEAIRSIPAEDPFWAVAEHLTKGIKEKQEVRPPLHHHKRSHPVWCALWFIYHNINSPEASIYQALQAQLLAAHIHFWRKDLTPRAPSRFYNASRLVRDGHTKDARWLLLEVQGTAEDPENLAYQFKGIKADLHRTARREIGGISSQSIGAFAEVIADAHDIPLQVFEDTHPSSGRGGTSRSRARRYQDRMGPDHSGYWYYSDDDLLLSSWGTERYRAHGQAPAKELQEELEMNGLAPAEYEAPESAELTFNTLLGVEEEEAHSAPVNLGALPPLSSVYARARGMARRIAMEAQRLRIEPTRIRLAQLGTLLQTLESIFTEASAAEEHERKKDNEARCLRWETALLASIALLTGSPPVSMATVLDPLADIKIDPPCRSQPAVFSLSR